MKCQEMNRIVTLLTKTSMSRGKLKAGRPKCNGKGKPAKGQGGARSYTPKANKVE